jgi:hypothetical protein
MRPVLISKAHYYKSRFSTHLIYESDAMTRYSRERLTVEELAVDCTDVGPDPFQPRPLGGV